MDTAALCAFAVPTHARSTISAGLGVVKALPACVESRIDFRIAFWTLPRRNTKRAVGSF